MKTNPIEVRSGDGRYYYHIGAPLFCPACGLAIRAIEEEFCFVKELLLAVYKCSGRTECGELFYALYAIGTATGNHYHPNLLYVYPRSYDDVMQKFDSVKATSPDFIAAHGQARNAQSTGDFELAACGYRNAAEILVKDYAMRFHNVVADDKLRYMSLNDCINKYLTGESDAVVGHMIRIFGNTAAHYPRIEAPFDFNEFMAYYGIFVSAMIKNVMIETAKNLLKK